MTAISTLIAMRTTPKNKLPLVCPCCEKADDPFTCQEHEVEQVFRGDTLKVNAMVTVCRHCGFEILAEGQLDELTQKVQVAYRKKHNLLPAAEIVARRKKLGMTQDQFAKHIAAGVASVKRWEAGYVQDKNSDQRIREKTGESQTDLADLVFAWISGGVPISAQIDREQLMQRWGADLGRVLSCKPEELPNEFIQARYIDFVVSSLWSGSRDRELPVVWPDQILVGDLNGELNQTMRIQTQIPLVQGRRPQFYSAQEINLSHRLNVKCARQPAKDEKYYDLASAA